jgi:type VI secretion system secreted protein VgrG
MANRITVNLPVEGLLFWKLSGHEAISEAFILNVTLLGTDARIDRSKLLGQSITVSIPILETADVRYLNGKVTRVAVSAVELSGTRYAAYTLTIEPDLWPMKRDQNLRIFQNQSVVQIIKTVLSDFQVNAEFKLSGDYRIWEYCVQYQESSFAFISRLMELEGISYSFQHQNGSHTMIITDGDNQYPTFNGYETIPYHQTVSGGSTTEEGISQWALEDSVTPGLYSLDDYDFRKPNAWLYQARQNPVSPTPGNIDVYDWPGRFVDRSQAQNYARIRQERWQVEHQQISGTATALGIAPGYRFTLTQGAFFDDNGEYLTIEAHYQLEENRYTSGNDGQTVYHIDFKVIPTSIPYRPAALTPWPRTYGPQTARVVGPQGETIWTDKYGRVKVKFHWDRDSQGDDTSSCWVRVSSAWASQGFGGVQVPRIGDEVVVDFINGDPDRPIITGRVYNEAKMPPWELPGNATRMGFMTRSKNGTRDNASHLFFEDKLGSESVDIHAEKDMSVSVENNQDIKVGGDQTININGNRTTTIGKTQVDTVTGDATFTYNSQRTTTVVHAETQEFKNHVDTTIANGLALNIVSGGREEKVVGADNLTVTGHVAQTISNGVSQNIQAGGVVQTIQAGGLAVEVLGGGWTQTVTGGEVTISSPNKITIHSDTEVNIDVPFMSANAHVHQETITANSASLIGTSESLTAWGTDVKLLSLSVTAFSVGMTGMKLENNPVNMYFDNGMKFRVAGVQWDNLKMSIQAAAAFMFI